MSTRLAMAAMAAMVGGCVLGGKEDGPSGSLEACAGDYEGTYNGADDGVTAATLLADGTLDVLFTSSAGEVNATGLVTEGGDVSGEEGIVSITGEFDFDHCTTGGTWYSSDVPSGSWNLDRL